MCIIVAKIANAFFCIYRPVMDRILQVIAYIHHSKSLGQVMIPLIILCIVLFHVQSPLKVIQNYNIKISLLEISP